METFKAMQSDWIGLWWHPEYNGFSSAIINLAQLKKFKGTVRILVRKNKYFNNGENNRPNYRLCIKDSSSPTFCDLGVVEDEDATGEDDWRYAPDGQYLYTEEEVRRVMHGACRDGQGGYDPFDLLISDYLGY